jgi:hypothetical protein
MLTSSSGGDKPWLATNGKTVFLATDWNRFRLLAPDGTPLGAEHVIPNAGDGSMVVASNGDRYLIAYQYGPFPYGTFLIFDADGAFLLSRPIQLTDSLGSVAIASHGSSFLLCVSTGGIGTNPSTAVSNFCTSIDAAGNTGALNVIGVGKHPFSDLAITWSGNEYTLVWTRWEDGQVFGARVDATGALLDATPVLVGFSSSGVVFSYNSLDRYGVLFASAWNGRDTIIITGDIDQYGPGNWYTTAAIFKSLPQIDAEPAARRHAAIASSAAEQAGGSIASNGTLSLVTWRESSGLGKAVLRAAFIAADGQLGVPIELGDAHFQTTTATASNGRDFLVAYYDAPHSTSSSGVGRLIARRVTLEGTLDSTPIVIPSNGDATDPIAIGWSGQAYVVLALVESLNVWLSGVTPDGTVALSRQFYVTLEPPDSPAISCAANGCSVTWHSATDLSRCYFEGCYSENDVFVRTDATGNPVAQALLTEYYPVTLALSLPASDGRSVFVYSKGGSMFAGRITDAGVVLDPPAINGGHPVMISDTSFALQPLAVVNSGLYFVEPDSATAGDLYWTHIEPEPTPYVTSLINLHQSVSLPLTMTASSRNAYLLYSSGEDDPQLMASRLFLRTIASPDPQPGSPRRRSTR